MCLYIFLGYLAWVAVAKCTLWCIFKDRDNQNCFPDDDTRHVQQELREAKRVERKNTISAVCIFLPLVLFFFGWLYSLAA